MIPARRPSNNLIAGRDYLYAADELSFCTDGEGVIVPIGRYAHGMKSVLSIVSLMMDKTRLKLSCCPITPGHRYGDCITRDGVTQQPKSVAAEGAECERTA